MIARKPKEYAPEPDRRISMLKLLAGAFLGGPMFGMLSVPIVRMIYNVPPTLERALSVENPQASRWIGYAFLIGLGVGLVMLRRWRWRMLLGLFFFQVLAFFILMAIYRS
ncbi:MAG: hypothetical protein OHK0046_13290 [Anaerolineae bacterium]